MDVWGETIRLTGHRLHKRFMSASVTPTFLGFKCFKSSITRECFTLYCRKLKQLSEVYLINNNELQWAIMYFSEVLLTSILAHPKPQAFICFQLECFLHIICLLCLGSIKISRVSVCAPSIAFLFALTLLCICTILSQKKSKRNLLTQAVTLY